MKRGKRIIRAMQNVGAAIAASAVIGTSAASAADEQQLQLMLKTHREAEYVLAADSICGLLNAEQRVAVDFVREHNWQMMLQDISVNTILQYSTTEMGRTDWADCPKRDQKPVQWALVDHYRMMGDAMAAAAGEAGIDPTDCKVGPSSPPLSKAAIARVGSAMAQKYKGSARRQAYVQQRDIFAANIANNCKASGQTGMLEPAFQADLRLAQPVEMQNRKSFVGLSGNVSIYGHRLAAGSTAALVRAALDLALPDEARADLTISADGSWTITVPAAVTAIELRDNYGNSGNFSAAAGQSATGGRAVFRPDNAAAEVLASTVNATRASLRFQTVQSAGVWQPVINSRGDVAEIHLEAVRDALKWAKSYTLEEVQ